MSVFFNAREIFEMAVQIEREGKRFYLETSKNAQDEPARNELARLAEMEAEHEAVFVQMMQDAVLGASAAQWYDPEGEAALYLQTFAEGQVFDLARPAPAELLEPGADLSKVLDYALAREADSVLFYTGLKELIPGAPDKAKVELIIKEEMGHIALLGQRLKQLRDVQ